jgi:hypothetical protein
METQLSSRITFTRPSEWVWHVWLDDKRVGTVNGDNLLGFTARTNDHHCIGQRYRSADAAMQSWVS